MANSRMMYTEKKESLADDAAVTFTPPFGCNTWQIRLFTNNHATTSIDVQTKDEDGDLIHVDGSPFTGSGGSDDFDDDGNIEITVDTSNPSIVVTADVVTAAIDVKCKAYRTLDDVASSGYDAL